MSACKQCEFKYVCGGTCRIDNFVAKGDLLTPICTKDYKENLLGSLYDNDRLFEDSIVI